MLINVLGPNAIVLKWRFSEKPINYILQLRFWYISKQSSEIQNSIKKIQKVSLNYGQIIPKVPNLKDFQKKIW